MKFNDVKELIQDLREGKMIILVDDEDRENEGDLVMAAPMIRPEDINFMAKNARGLICLTLTEARCAQLKLPMMVDDVRNNSSHGTPFTLSIEAAEGVTTGISAADRAKTIQVAVASNCKPEDIVQPGHVFPLKAKQGGVLSRAGHTEAGCDLARMAGFEPASVIVEIMNEDGSMARRDDLERFAKEHELKIGTIADLIHYRLVNEKTVECIDERKVKTIFGEFILKTYLDNILNEKHFAMVMGNVEQEDSPLVRVHVNRSARDILSIESKSNYKAWSFSNALERVAKEGCGAVVLLYYPETGDEISKNIQTILDPNAHTSQAPEDVVYHQIGTGSQILMDLGIRKMRLMSAPFKFTAISGFDLQVVEHVAVEELRSQ